MYESQCERHALPVRNSLHGFRGRKVTLKNRVQELCDSRGRRSGLPVPNKVPTVSLDVK